jgi:hypothetical protein
MKKPQFAERQYETAAHIELALGRASPFVPTQNIEMYLGIDAAADPVKAHAIWRILSVQIPRRISLSPELWPALPRRFHDQIPGRFCSLFLQFKRPVFQDHARAKYHKRIGGPYFEVGITRHQQMVLLNLEQRVTKHAVVRYASPAFWSRQEFDRFDEKRTVLVNSAFIAPARVKSHKRWMYGGVNGKVILNPDPEDTDPDDWGAVIRSLEAQAVRQSLRQHVRLIASAVGQTVEPRVTADGTPWFRRILQYGQMSVDDAGLVMDLISVAQAADSAEAVWLILLLPEEQWGQLLREERHLWWPWHGWYW